MNSHSSYNNRLVPVELCHSCDFIYVLISHIPVESELSEHLYMQEQLTIPYNADITFTDTADGVFGPGCLRPTAHCVESVETNV